MAHLTTYRTQSAKLGTMTLLTASLLFCTGLLAQGGADGGAKITAVGPIGTQASQKFAIQGTNFGTYKPYNGCEPFLQITDLTSNQVFGQSSGGSCLAILVTSWTDTEIDVEGFPPLDPGRNVFNLADAIRIEVANPQQQGTVPSGDNFSGAPVSWFSARVGGDAAPLPDAPRARNAAPPAVASTPPAPANGITIPAGEPLLVRMIDGVDSSKNQVGDIFHASLETDLNIDGILVARKGADVYGRLAQAKEAGHFSGSSELELELTRIVIDGRDYPVVSSDYSVQGKGRGKNTAEKVGGGALLGALIGGLAGGGKGAAIGAGAGAGAGGAVQVFTRGQQVKVPSETLLEFRLEQPATVTPTGK
jgi:hypothetical protein